MGADNWDNCPKCKAEGKLREDYEIFIMSGVFHVLYTGVCKQCDFEFNHQYSEPLNLKCKTCGNVGTHKLDCDGG